MNRYLLGVASVFVMFFHAAMSGLLPSPTCDVSPTMDQIMEIREIFVKMRSAVQQQDKYIHLRMLETSSIQNIPPSDRCCFLKHIIHFYMTKVFRHYYLLDMQHHSSANNIANSFCALSRGPNSCQFNINCDYGDVANNKLKTIEDIFRKLTLSKAVIKAFAELDILLDWMETLF